jgi:P27 family predicted phage terminase small subunit
MPRHATGAPRGRRHRPLQRELPAGWRAPSPPRGLGATGRKWWRTIWRGGATWLDASIDCLLIESVCQAADQVQAIEAHLDEVGRWYETKQAVLVAHPGVADIRQLQAFITSRMSLLGFSPSDRARLNLTMKPGSDDDLLAQFRKRHPRPIGNFEHP